VVTIFSSHSSYRFLRALHARSTHARNISEDIRVQSVALQDSAFLGRVPHSHGEPSGGHNCAAAASLCRQLGGQLLLPLRGIERANRLRQDVRIEEIRHAVVGNFLRQTTDANAGR
jgi:hypothetical protein